MEETVSGCWQKPSVFTGLCSKLIPPTTPPSVSTVLFFLQISYPPHTSVSDLLQLKNFPLDWVSLSKLTAHFTLASYLITTEVITTSEGGWWLPY